MAIYDVSVPLRSGMPTYDGEPGPHLDPLKQIARGDSANVTALSLGSHTGTHVDAPHHFLDGRSTVEAMPLEALVGPSAGDRTDRAATHHRRRPRSRLNPRGRDTPPPQDAEQPLLGRRRVPHRLRRPHRRRRRMAGRSTTSSSSASTISRSNASAHANMKCTRYSSALTSSS